MSEQENMDGRTPEEEQKDSKNLQDQIAQNQNQQGQSSTEEKIQQSQSSPQKQESPPVETQPESQSQKIDDPQHNQAQQDQKLVSEPQQQKESDQNQSNQTNNQAQEQLNKDDQESKPQDVQDTKDQVSDLKNQGEQNNKIKQERLKQSEQLPNQDSTQLGQQNQDQEQLPSQDEQVGDEKPQNSNQGGEAENQQDKIDGQPPQDKQKSPQNQGNTQIKEKEQPLKKNVIYYEKNGITYESEQPNSTQKLNSFVSNAGQVIQKQNTQKFASFAEKLQKKSQEIQKKQEEDSLAKSSLYPTYVTSIKPIKKEPQKQVKSQTQLQKVIQGPQKKKGRQTIVGQAQLMSPREQRDTISKQERKRQLKEQLEQIQRELKTIEQDPEPLPKNSPQEQPKLKVIVTPIQEDKKEPPIRKFNQVAVMIGISDDEQKRMEAHQFIMKLNQERREREMKALKDYQQIELKIKRDIGVITKEQKIMTESIEKERKLKIMERITQQERRKYETAMKQQITKNFLKELKQQGGKNGLLSQEHMHYLKQNFNDITNEQILPQLDQAQEVGTVVNSNSPSPAKPNNRYGSIFLPRVIQEDKQRLITQKYQQAMKRDLYQKRKHYAKLVNDKFLPKVHSSNLLQDPEVLLYKNYLYRSKDNIDPEQYVQEQMDKIYEEVLSEDVQQQVMQAEQQQLDSQRIRKFTKQRAWQVHHELFDKKPV